MSSQRFNFNDTVSDAFEFEIAGLAYDMRYPTQDEMRPFAKLIREYKVAEDQGDLEKAEKANDKMEAFIHGLITPVGHDTPIKDTLKKVNVVILRHLHKRLLEELVS